MHVGFDDPPKLAQRATSEHEALAHYRRVRDEIRTFIAENFWFRDDTSAISNEESLLDAGIIRNRAKVESAVKNARAFLKLQEEFGSFAAYQWRFVDGAPVQNAWTEQKQVPATSPASDAMSKDLKKRGFSFVGSTIVYAFMQAVGMVNDHLVSCFRHREVARLA